MKKMKIDSKKANQYMLSGVNSDFMKSYVQNCIDDYTFKGDDKSEIAKQVLIDLKILIDE